MIQFVITNILMLAAGVMLYLFVRSLPRLEEEKVPRRTLLHRWLSSRVPERIDQALQASSLKVMRRTRVLILKADNALSGKLQQANKKRLEPAMNFDDLQERDSKESLPSKES